MQVHRSCMSCPGSSNSGHGSFSAAKLQPAMGEPVPAEPDLPLVRDFDDVDLQPACESPIAQLIDDGFARNASRMQETLCIEIRKEMQEAISKIEKALAGPVQPMRMEGNTMSNVAQRFSFAKDVAPPKMDGRTESSLSEPPSSSKLQTQSPTKSGKLSASILQAKVGEKLKTKLHVNRDKAKEEKEAKQKLELDAFLAAKGWTIAESRNDGEEAEEEERFNLVPTQELDTDNSIMGKGKAFVASQSFDLIFGSLIVVNALVMALNLEFDGSHTAAMLGLQPDTPHWTDADTVFLYFEHFFTVAFTVELISRLAANGFRYLRSFSNLMDAVIVLVSILDLYMLALIGIENFPNVSFLRLLRIAKLAKVLRIVRVMQAFRQLRILMHAIVSSISALLWSLALLSVIQLIGSIFMAQTLSNWMRDGNQNIQEQQEVYAYFGTMGRSYLTLFQMTIAPGSWVNVGRLIIFKVNGIYAIFFYLYVAGVTFAVITVIRAIFLKETLASANSDADIVVTELAHEKGKIVRKLQKIFKALDQDNSGDISIHELKDMLKSPDLQALFHSLELSSDQAEGFFELIDDGDGKLSFDEFLTGILRFKGGAHIDLVTMLFENKKIIDRIWLLDQSLKVIKDELYTMREDIFEIAHPLKSLGK